MTESHSALAHAETVGLVAGGGLVGANARYLVDALVVGPLGGVAVGPVGARTATLAINVVGAALLGLVLYRAVYAGRLDERVRLLVATGTLSSLTTYSAFALQTFQAAPVAAVTTVGATYGLGFAGVLLGRAVARRRWGPTEVDT